MTTETFILPGVQPPLDRIRRFAVLDEGHDPAFLDAQVADRNAGDLRQTFAERARQGLDLPANVPDPDRHGIVDRRGQPDAPDAERPGNLKPMPAS
ncbi:MAG: hypothetical protein SCM96_11365 [Acidobacteriota bacterium]|nr:hypothetical protein [Acidobacteriota bacterium]